MTSARKPLLARRGADILFQMAALLAIGVALSTIIALIAHTFYDGFGRLSWDFLTNPPSRIASKAGIYPALMGSLSLMGLLVVIALPLGVGAALYLEEYAPKNRLTQLIELNIANLAGVPSIIYGLLGLDLFVRVLKLDRSLISGALILSLLVLPIIIMAAREAIKTVPRAYRDASLALGATKWQTIWHHVLPNAFPGIMTGCILAFSRAIGETAPLITMGALTYVAFAPDSLFSAFTALPIQAFNWISRPQAAFHENAAAAIVVLLMLLLTMNATAIFLRQRLQRRER